MSIGEIGELLRRSTVHIRSTHQTRGTAGSGVIWDEEGTIVTNAHVLGAGPHQVELWDGRSFPADVKARDDRQDLARIELRTAGLPAAALRHAPLKPGELVVAVGNPLGVTGALTTGIVHAQGPAPGFGRKPWVQAAIRLAPGNSGGPLADAAGRVAGLNTMVVSGGIALAIPTATVAEFLLHPARPQIGVTVRPVQLPHSGRVALLVLAIKPGSPADRASLLMGDLLIGTPTRVFATALDLLDAIENAGLHPLRLRFLRGDRAHEREVVIAPPVAAAREAA